MRKRFPSNHPIQHAEPQVPQTYPSYPQLEKLKPLGPISSEKEGRESQEERLLRFSRDVRSKLIQNHFQRDEVSDKEYINLKHAQGDSKMTRWDDLILTHDPKFVPEETLASKQTIEQLIRKLYYVKQMKKLDILLNEEEIDDTQQIVLFEPEKMDEENVDRDDAKEFADAMRCEDDEELEDDEREFGGHGQDDEGEV